MKTIKNIIAESGEDCRVDIDIMHESLTKLPAEMYLNLYRKMHMNIYGYPPVVNWGGCCGVEEEKPKLKAEIDYSALDETMDKVEEINAAAEKFKDLIEELQHKHVPIYVDVVEKKDK